MSIAPQAPHRCVWSSPAPNQQLASVAAALRPPQPRVSLPRKASLWCFVQPLKHLPFTRHLPAAFLGDGDQRPCHGVSRFDWLLPAQVKPEPDSLTTVPNDGLAITLTHGSGVEDPGPR